MVRDASVAMLFSRDKISRGPTAIGSNVMAQMNARPDILLYKIGESYRLNYTDLVKQ